MRVTSDWPREAERTRRAPRQVRDVLWQQVRASAFRVKREVQRQMPVDTGRARASWGNVPASFPAQFDDGVWEEDEAGLRITQGTNVEYVANLNEGSSYQAPAGFIDAEATREKNAFARDVLELLTQMGVL